MSNLFAYFSILVPIPFVTIEIFLSSYSGTFSICNMGTSRSGVWLWYGLHVSWLWVAGGGMPIPGHNISYSFDGISLPPFEVRKFMILLPYGLRHAKNALMYFKYVR